MPYVFGVDGGGTKSRAMLATTTGKVVYLGEGDCINYHDVGVGTVSATLKHLFTEAQATARARADEIQGVCLGLAGSGRLKDKTTLQPMLDGLFGKNSYILMSDAEIALVGGTYSEYGVVVLAGTGSMIFGRNEKDVTARMGGYGPLVSDAGSAYRIVQEGLRVAIQSFDYEETLSPFLKAVLKHLEIETLPELITWLHARDTTRKRIAAMAYLMLQAAELDDDPLAEDVLNHEADTLALGVDSLIKKLEMPNTVDIVLSGGLFKNSTYYTQLMQRKIHYLLPAVNIIPPTSEPVVGSVLYALNYADIELNEDLFDTLSYSFKEYVSKQEKVQPSN